MPSPAIFVAEKAAGASGAEAARRAGYSPRSARIQASTLQTKPNIAAAIEAKEREYVQRVEEHAVWTRLTVLQELRNTYDAAIADKQYGAATKCLDLAGRNLKLWDAGGETNVTILAQFNETVRALPDAMLALIDQVEEGGGE